MKKGKKLTNLQKKVLKLLKRKKKRAITDICKDLDVDYQYLIKKIKELETMDLVKSFKFGRVRVYYLKGTKVRKDYRAGSYYKKKEIESLKLDFKMKCWICKRTHQGIESILSEDSRNDLFQEVGFLKEGFTNREIFICPICKRIINFVNFVSRNR